MANREPFRYTSERLFSFMNFVDSRLLTFRMGMLNSFQCRPSSLSCPIFRLSVPSSSLALSCFSSQARQLAALLVAGTTSALAFIPVAASNGLFLSQPLFCHSSFLSLHLLLFLSRQAKKTAACFHFLRKDSIFSAGNILSWTKDYYIFSLKKNSDCRVSTCFHKPFVLSA